MTAATRTLWIGFVSSAAAIVAGAILLAVSVPATSASFGWFAYQPLANATFFPGFIASPGVLIGAVLVVLGLVGLAFTGGVAVGRRSAARGS